jgi:broad specificity phosphatase PhoE
MTQVWIENLRRIAAAVFLFSVGLIALGSAPRSIHADDEALWGLLRSGGYVVLMRHGLTFPETSEPPGARVEDCSTQRNLGDPGREEARRVGAAFRAHGIPVGKVLSSRWCRCLETARLAFGKVEPWRDLEFAGWDDTPEKRRRDHALRSVLGKRPEQGNTVLVSHGFVIGPLVDATPRTAEFFVLAPQPNGTFRVVGHLAPDELQ